MEEQAKGPGTAQPKKLRGFAAMPAAQRKAIAAKGGRVVHALCRAPKFTREECRAAGRKGGKAVHARGKAFKFDSETGRAAGRKGQEARKKLKEGGEA